ncbi:MAG: YbjQ family protein [Candidatus Methylacidiphilales bacterium]|nr:YbjQ family protein [Candidatus Methylacidiphilales bacterium]
MDPLFTTTGFELPGYRVTRSLGVVRGVVCRSRSVIGNMMGGIQTLFGGNITIYTELCEKARAQAFDLMLQHAAQVGGNAIIGIRYDANEVMEGVAEVLCYGTAVVIETKQ